MAFWWHGDGGTRHHNSSSLIKTLLPFSSLSPPPLSHTRAQVNASGSAFAAALESLPLDELELGSLRGVLVGAVADVDLAAQTGRVAANLASPRFSGLAGTSLSMNAR